MVIFSYNFTYFSTVVKSVSEATQLEGKLAGNVKWHGQCKLRQRREHQAGLPSSPSPNTDLPSTITFYSDIPKLLEEGGCTVVALKSTPYCLLSDCSGKFGLQVNESEQK